MRNNDRSEKALREIKIESGFSLHAEGSCLISVGNTKVICTASVDEKVPPFLRNSGKGWVTSRIRNAAAIYGVAHGSRSRTGRTNRANP